MQIKTISSETTAHFDERVNSWLKEGWKLHGPIQVNTNIVPASEYRLAEMRTLYVQVLIKE